VRYYVALRLGVQARPVAQRAVLDIDHTFEGFIAAPRPISTEARTGRVLCIRRG
jgi:hypothetical protein